MDINIISIGDTLAPGHYIIHSKFESVINFVLTRDDSSNASQQVASVAAKKIGGGPNVIVIEPKSVLQQIKKLEITTSTIRLANRVFDKQDITCYNSSIAALFAPRCKTSITRVRLKNNLEFLKTYIMERANENSLTFLLNTNQATSLSQANEDAIFSIFSEKMLTGIDLICTVQNDLQDYLTGIKLVKGLGFGLTPSGDDLIMGILVALNILERLPIANMKLPTNIKTRTMTVVENTPSNLISEMFLRFAYQGKLFARMQKVITTLLYKSKKPLKSAIDTVLAIGATSGADSLTGLYITMKCFLA